VRPALRAQRRAATLLSISDLLGQGRGRPVAAEGIRAEDIRAVALEPLSPVAVKAVANLTAHVLRNVDAIAAILAGLCLMGETFDTGWLRERP